MTNVFFYKLINLGEFVYNKNPNSSCMRICVQGYLFNCVFYGTMLMLVVKNMESISRFRVVSFYISDISMKLQLQKSSCLAYILVVARQALNITNATVQIFILLCCVWRYLCLLAFCVCKFLVCLFFLTKHESRQFVQLFFSPCKCEL